MTLEDVKSEIKVPEHDEVLEENREIFEELLNCGFRIVTESSYMNYHKNVEETRNRYYLGIEDDGEVKRISFNYPDSDIANVARKSMCDVLSLEPKDSGEGEFVEAKMLQTLKPKQVARVLSMLIGAIWKRERAASKLENRNKRLKDGLMKLL